MKDIIISTVICTYNRCESLKDTLDSLLRSEKERAFDVEFIIVDNNSNDGTKQTVINYMPLFKGSLRYIFESKQGKSNALNAGMKEAKGDIIAFTDDDVIVDEKWLQAIFHGFCRYDPDLLFGKILPKWQGCAPPDWLLKNKKYFANLAMLDYGNEVQEINSEDKDFYGANFAIKREIYLQGYRFDENLGPSAVGLMRGEDTKLFYKLLADKRKIIYTPDVVVWHKADKERLKRSYFRKWHYHWGISSARMEKDRKFIRYFNIPRGQIRALFELPLKWFISMCLLKPDQTIPFEFRFFYTLGYIFGCLTGKKGRS